MYQDSLAGIRIVQSFANEDIEGEKFRLGNEAFLDSKRDNYHAMGSFQSGNILRRRDKGRHEGLPEQKRAQRGRPGGGKDL